jgi:hypothetical protein
MLPEKERGGRLAAGGGAIEGGWSTPSAVTSAAGAGSNSVQIDAPATNVTVFYRIIATNAKGDSVAYTFWLRG